MHGRQTKSPTAAGLDGLILLQEDYRVLTQPELAFDHSY
jgi:hypothetical protein